MSEPRPDWGSAGAAVLGLALLLGLVACATPPARELAARHGLSGEVVRGDPFLHQVYRNRAGGRRLHVYLEGDGTPWQTRHEVAMDPTSKRPLMLQLMLLDPQPALYLGRPCYHRVADVRCEPRWWTWQRYAPEVVVSLNRVLQHYASRYDEIVLIGHSGGGTLAMLLAARRCDVAAVLTLAGNLDPDAWALAHHYTPLQGSLSPAREPPLPDSIWQLHVLGEEDANITREMIAPVVARQGRARLLVAPGQDHGCCWSALWPALLARQEAALAAPGRQARHCPGPPVG
ncbi:alpha/beta hydrolase [Parahaliea mediterranea]|uniref:Alpha/beta hydrolase n=1 Tax=Parahaliea mediterranea TaxID=651086 RepID=A0A939DBS1_9GAMM|nr:hypothetical protein [Parahaliea mediterranea]MBN7794996.1 hypothetical protein [Parahaliea mediterranea]